MSPPSPSNPTESFYDNAATHTFYSTLWGGEDVHIGIYSLRSTPSIRTASRLAVSHLASRLSQPPTSCTRVLDLGSGYGGAARYLATVYKCKVTCLNLSEVQNEYNRDRNRQEGLDHLIEVRKGDFEDTGLEDGAFELVWSQDAFLHSRDRRRLFREIERVLVKEGGELVFTDPMAQEGADKEALKPVLRRLQLENLETVKGYEEHLKWIGFADVQYEDLSENLGEHYGLLSEELEKRKRELVGEEKMDEVGWERVREGMKEAEKVAKRGDYIWGAFCCRR
ncbi:MAG: hypothetical protein LQ342_003663 [Letrouitia transgressa]|nr:MAG: hypothetical protein LQ342_003663 [Letrouitia transgressa]